VNAVSLGWASWAIRTWQGHELPAGKAALPRVGEQDIDR
jgi:hypothetical protein